MMVKISPANVRFYSRHYNRLVQNFNTGEEPNYQQILMSISSNYYEGIIEKRKDEMKFMSKRYKRRHGFTKKDKLKKDKAKRKKMETNSTWFFLGIFLFTVLSLSQLPRSIFTSTHLALLSKSIKNLIKIPISLDSYLVMNLLTFKLTSFSFEEYPIQAEFKATKELYQKVSFGHQVLQSQPSQQRRHPTESTRNQRRYLSAEV